MTKDHRHEIIENFSQYHIGIDDVFAFKCRECGKCCRGREDILLNSRDLYNIAMALDMTHKQVIEKYCDAFIGRDSRFPIVRLKPKGASRVCPLLSGDRCSVHLLKPVVCALAPLGRVMLAEAATEHMGAEIDFDPELYRINEIQYILTSTACGSAKRKQTVRQWLENYSIPTNDKFFIKWNEALFKLVTVVQQHEGKDYATDRAMEMMWSAIYSSLYIDYDTRQEFHTQFENNISKLLRIFDGLEKVF
jgi:Fe-S-cluster containining protein